MTRDQKDNFSSDLTFYKARTSGDGCASQWSFRPDKQSVFLEMAKQTGKNDNGNATFGWKDGKIVFKLGVSDIGELLAVVTGIQRGVGPFDRKTSKHKGLYHSNTKGNAVLYFGLDDNDRYNIYLSVKRDSEQIAMRHTFSNGEVCVLAVLLRKAVEEIYKW